MYRRYKAIKRDPANRTYMDEALTPVADDENERLEIFQTGEAKAYVAQERRLAKVRAGRGLSTIEACRRRPSRPSFARHANSAAEAERAAARHRRAWRNS